MQQGEHQAKIRFRYASTLRRSCGSLRSAGTGRYAAGSPLSPPPSSPCMAALSAVSRQRQDKRRKPVRRAPDPPFELASIFEGIKTVDRELTDAFRMPINRLGKLRRSRLAGSQPLDRRRRRAEHLHGRAASVRLSLARRKGKGDRTIGLTCATVESPPSHLKSATTNVSAVSPRGTVPQCVEVIREGSLAKA